MFHVMQVNAKKTLHNATNYRNRTISWT